MHTRFFPAFVHGLVIAIIYLLTQANNLSVAHDSISYLNSIESDPLLTFHPHHLLYQLIAAIVSKLSVFGMDAQFWVQSLNAIFGGGVSSIFFLILRDRFQMNQTFAHIASIFPAFSYGIWAYSTVVEVYMIPLFFLIITFYLLTSDELTNRKMILIGIFHGLAILFHQSHILFIPVVIWAVFQHPLTKEDLGGFKNLRGLNRYVLTIGLLVASSYFIVMIAVLKLHTFDEMLNWMIGYGNDDQYWETGAIGMIFKSGVGLFRSIFGGHFLFALPFFEEMTTSSGYSLTDEGFLVRNMPNWVAVSIGIGIIIFSILMAIGLFKAIYNRSNYSSNQKRIYQLILIWIISYSAFFVFWVPVNPEFWLPQFLALSLVIISGWYRWLSSRSLAYWLVLFVLMNYAGSIYWLADPKNDFYHEKVQAIAVVAKAEDLILIGQPWILPAYIDKYVLGEKYLLPANWQELPQWDEIQKEIYQRLQYGNQVLVSSELWLANPSIWKSFESHSKIMSSPSGSWLCIKSLSIKD